MAKTPATGGIESTKLRSYIERLERLEEEKSALASDIRDVFAEAKSNGFDTKTMRQVLKLRKMKTNDQDNKSETLARHGCALVQRRYRTSVRQL